MSIICSCCCIKPATRECTERSYMWRYVCDECLEKHISPQQRYIYEPPDGKRLDEES